MHPNNPNIGYGQAGYVPRQSGTSSVFPQSVQQFAARQAMMRPDAIRSDAQAAIVNAYQNVDSASSSGMPSVAQITQYVKQVMDQTARTDAKQRALESIKMLLPDMQQSELANICPNIITMLNSIFATTKPAFMDTFIDQKIRKLVLDLAIKYIPLDCFKASNHAFEDSLVKHLLIENEANAIIIFRYILEAFRAQKWSNTSGLSELVDRFEKSIRDILRASQENTDFFRSSVSPEILADFEKGNGDAFVQRLYFEVKVKSPPPVNIYPPAKNSVKLATDFVSMLNSFMTQYRDRSIELLDRLITLLTDVLATQPNLATDPPPDRDHLASFHDLQTKAFMFMAFILKLRRDHSSSASLTLTSAVIQQIRPHCPKIVKGLTGLLTNLGPNTNYVRREIFSALKFFYGSEILRNDLMDLVPFLLNDAVFFSPGNIMQPDLYGEIMISRADIIHSIRYMVEFSLLNQFMMTGLNDFLNFTLSPQTQLINSRTVISLCESYKTVQISCGSSYNNDVARQVLQCVLDAAFVKVNVLVTHGIRVILNRLEKPQAEPQTMDRVFEVTPLMATLRESAESRAFIRRDDRDRSARFQRFRDVISAIVSAVREQNCAVTDEAQLAANGKDFDAILSRLQLHVSILGDEQSEMHRFLSEELRLLKENRSDLIRYAEPLEWVNDIFWCRNVCVPHTTELLNSEFLCTCAASDLSTFKPYDMLPYDYNDMKSLLRNTYQIARSVLELLDSIDSVPSSQSFYWAEKYNRFIGDTLSVMDFFFVNPDKDEGYRYAPMENFQLTRIDKETLEFFINLLNFLHPAFIEVVFAHHFPAIFQRITNKSFFMNVFVLLISYDSFKYQQCIYLVTSDFAIDNVELLFSLDESMVTPNSTATRLVKIFFSYITMHTGCTVHDRRFIKRIQKFFRDVTYYGLRMSHRVVDCTLIGLIIRFFYRSMTPAYVEQFFEVIPPLFPAFIRWFADARNTVSCDQLQEFLGEISQIVPTRLSSITLLLPALLECTNYCIASSNSALLPAALRTLDLIVDNMDPLQVRELLGAYRCKIIESLILTARSMDMTMFTQASKILAKLAGNNRDAINDIHRLNCAYEERVPRFFVEVPRSGKDLFDGLFSANLDRYTDTNAQRRVDVLVRSDDGGIGSLPPAEQAAPERNPIEVVFRLQEIVTVALHNLRCSIVSDMTQKVVLTPRGESYELCIRVLSLFSDNELDLSPAQLQAAVANAAVQYPPATTFLPAQAYRADGKVRELVTDSFLGLVYASAHSDIQPMGIPRLDGFVTVYTINLNLELAYYHNHPGEKKSASHLDSFVLIDVIKRLLTDSFVKFHQLGIGILARVIQTATTVFNTHRSFVIDALMRELAELCHHLDPVHRIGAATALRFVVENCPEEIAKFYIRILYRGSLNLSLLADSDLSNLSVETNVLFYNKLFGCVQDDPEALQALLAVVEGGISVYQASASVALAEQLSTTIVFLHSRLGLSQTENIFVTSNFFKFFNDHYFVATMDQKMALNLLMKTALTLKPETISAFNHGNYLVYLIDMLRDDIEGLARPANMREDVLQPFNITYPPESDVVRPASLCQCFIRAYHFRFTICDALTQLVITLAKFNGISAVDVVFTGAGVQRAARSDDSPVELIQYALNFLIMVATTVPTEDDVRPNLACEALEQIQKHVAIKNLLDVVRTMFHVLESPPSNAKNGHSFHLLPLLNSFISRFEGDDASMLVFNRHMHALIEAGNTPLRLLFRCMNPSSRALDPISAFLEIYTKLAFKSKRFLCLLFLAVSSHGVLEAFEFGRFNFFDIVVRFLANDEDSASVFFGLFFTEATLCNAQARQALLFILASESAAAKVAAKSMYVYLAQLTDILIDGKLKNKKEVPADVLGGAVEMDTTEPNELPQQKRVEQENWMKQLPDLICFAIKVIWRYAELFPDWFLQNASLINVLKRLIASFHFRFNFLVEKNNFIQNAHGLPANMFSISKVEACDVLVNLLIRYFEANIYDFDVLFALSGFVTHRYYSGSIRVRKFIDVFVVRRMSIEWRQRLMRATTTYIKHATKTTIECSERKALAESEDFSVRQAYAAESTACSEFDQILTLFLDYVVYPCIAMALANFSFDYVVDCDRKLASKRGATVQKNELPTASIVDDFFNGLPAQEKFCEFWPPLINSYFNFITLFIVRCTTSIHIQGSKTQGRNLHISMQLAWPALTAQGVYGDRVLRGTVMVMLGYLLNNVYIKRDIVCQIFDNMMLRCDNRDSPSNREALRLLSHHFKTRKDDCMEHICDRIRDMLYDDSTNLVKIMNAALLLSSNSEAYFQCRRALSPPLLLVAQRCIYMRPSYPLLRDIAETFINWEEIRLTEVAVHRKGWYSSSSAAMAATNGSARLEENFNAKMKTLKLDPMEKTSMETLANVISRLLLYQDSEFTKQVAIKTLQLEALAAVAITRIDRYFLRESQRRENTPLMQSTATIKTLSLSLPHLKPEHVLNLLRHFQNYLTTGMAASSGARDVRENCFRLVVSCVDAIKGHLVPIASFAAIYNVLAAAVAEFAARFESGRMQEENLVVLLMKIYPSLCKTHDEQIVRKVVSFEWIRLISLLLNTCGDRESRGNPQHPVPDSAETTIFFKKTFSSTICNAFGTVVDHIDFLADNIVRCFVRDVVVKLLSRYREFTLELHEVICRLLYEMTHSAKFPVLRDECVLLLQLIMRLHYIAMSKHASCLKILFGSVFVIMQGERVFDASKVELWIAYYSAMSNNGDVDIRRKFLDDFDRRIPRNLFERFIYIFVNDTWVMLSAPIFSAIVEVVLRAIPACTPSRPLSSSQFVYVGSEVYGLSSSEALPPKPPRMEPALSCFGAVPSFLGTLNGAASTEMSPAKPNGGSVLKNLELSTLPFRSSSQYMEQYISEMTACRGYFNTRGMNVFELTGRLLTTEFEAASKVLADIFTSMWTCLTTNERRLMVKCLSAFITGGYFRNVHYPLGKFFFTMLERCKPDLLLPIDVLCCAPTSIRFMHHEIVQLERELASPHLTQDHRSKVVTYLRRLYSFIGETDLEAETWATECHVPRFHVAYRLYNQYQPVECLTVLRAAHQEALERIRTRPADSSDPATDLRILSDFERTKDLSIKCLVETMDFENLRDQTWAADDVFSHAVMSLYNYESGEFLNGNGQVLDAIVASEDEHYSCQTFFIAELLALRSRDWFWMTNANEYSRMRDRRLSVISERWRQMPAIFAPCYVDALVDFTFCYDVSDFLVVIREVARSNAKLSSFPEASVRQLLSNAHKRKPSKAESPELACRYAFMRYLSLKFLLDELRKTEAPRDRVVDELTQTVYDATYRLLHGYVRELESMREYDRAIECITNFMNDDACKAYNSADRIDDHMTLLRLHRKKAKYESDDPRYLPTLDDLPPSLRAVVENDFVDLDQSVMMRVRSAHAFFARPDGVRKLTAQVLTAAVCTPSDMELANGATPSYMIEALRNLVKIMRREFMGTTKPAVDVCQNLTMASAMLMSSLRAFEAIRYVPNVVLAMRYLWKEYDLAATNGYQSMIRLLLTVNPMTFFPHLDSIILDVVAGNSAWLELVARIAVSYPTHVIHAVRRHLTTKGFREAMLNSERYYRFFESHALNPVGQKSAAPTNFFRFDDRAHSAYRQDMRVFHESPTPADDRPSMQWQRSKLNGIFNSICADRQTSQDEPLRVLAACLNVAFSGSVSAYLQVVDGLNDIMADPQDAVIEGLMRAFRRIKSAVLTDPTAPDVPTDVIDALNDALAFGQMNDWSEDVLQLLRSPPATGGQVVQQLTAVIDYVRENCVSAHQTVPPKLYNYSLNTGSLPSLSNLVNKTPLFCIPCIRGFGYQMKVVVEGLHYYKLLEVILDNGHVCTYRVEVCPQRPASTGHVQLNSLLMLLNPILERDHGVNRRSAFFRSSAVIELDSVRLIEVNDRVLNTTLPYANTQHTFSELFGTAKCIQKLASTPMGPAARKEYLAEQDDNLVVWFDRHFEDWSTHWYERKSLATQLALHAVAHVAFASTPCDTDDLILELVSGRIIEPSEYWSVENLKLAHADPEEALSRLLFPFLTPQVVKLLSSALAGTFVPTVVAVAQGLNSKKFFDVATLHLSDLALISNRQIHKVMEHIEDIFQRLHVLADYDGTDEALVHQLTRQSTASLANCI